MSVRAGARSSRLNVTSDCYRLRKVGAAASRDLKANAGMPECGRGLRMKKLLAIGLGALLGASASLAVAAPPPPPHPNLPGPPGPPGPGQPIFGEFFIEEILAIEASFCEHDHHGERDAFGFCRPRLSP
jgi:hypothetical protein